MSYLCKMCGLELITYSRLSDDQVKRGYHKVWQCGMQVLGTGCTKYVIWEANGTIIFEWIDLCNLNTYLKYNTTTKQAQVLLNNNYIEMGTIQDFTPEIAKSWYERLKNYVIYL